MYAKGVELWCAPTVDDREVWSATMVHIALEGRCFVLSANQYVVRSDVPDDVHPVQGDDADTVLIGGGSMIVSPLGAVLSGPLRGTEGVLIAELDLGDIARAHFDMDVVGHYSRPDVCTLHVDTSSRRTLVWPVGARVLVRPPLRGPCEDAAMRMLLTSGGVQPGPIQDTLLDLLGMPLSDARTAVVLDAILPFPGDKSTMLRHLEQYRALGWRECDILSLFSGPRSVIESRLRSADVIFGYGGSNHWLAHAWTATGLAPLLRELLDEKVYIGISAGSMIFSRLHAAAVDAFDDHDEVEMLQLDSVAPALPLFDWLVMSHLGASFFPHQTDEWAAEGARRLGGPVWFLDDRSALLVRGPAADPEVVSSGHWLRFDGSGHLVDSGE